VLDSLDPVDHLGGSDEGLPQAGRRPLVGDYLQVVSHVPDEDQRPECFRRVEKIEYIEAPTAQVFANRQY